jgi:hypothetical protein
MDVHRYKVQKELKKGHESGEHQNFGLLGVKIRIFYHWTLRHRILAWA